MSFFKKILHSTPKPKESLDTKNPFVLGNFGRREWDDRYFNMKKSIFHWQLAFIGVLFIGLLMAGVNIKIASQSRIKPFVVEMNQGIPIGVKPMTSISSNDHRLISFAVNQFIVNSRSVLSDPNAEKNLLNKVYAYSANKTLHFLTEYFEKNDPFAIARKYSVDVQIVNSMPLSKDTWQVIWDETKKSITNGQEVDKTRWMANLTLKFGEVNKDFINDNPFGLFITDVAWSQHRTAPN